MPSLIKNCYSLISASFNLLGNVFVENIKTIWLHKYIYSSKKEYFDIIQGNCKYTILQQNSTDGIKGFLECRILLLITKLFCTLLH